MSDELISLSPEEIHSNIKTRDHFADLCNSNGLIEAVEIGTDRGTFAATFLSRWNGNTLVCVDPYEPYLHMPFDRTPDMMMACEKLSHFGDKAKILRCTSEKALEWMRQYYVDFVYIDGDHSYKNVSLDIDIWWEKLAPGGILAGHDYCEESREGVIKAVQEHAEKIEQSIMIVADAYSPDSWYFTKPRK